MDYRVASNIRGKSLSSLITDKITSGGSVGSSIKGAISDKLKAKGAGIKEKFDPLNIARAMTGGGKLAPAILGRMTGRSQSDINYFAGNKKKFSTYTKMPSIGQVPSEGFGGSAIEVLNKMLSFMQKNREDDLKRKEIHQSFEEERQSEEERRHNQFLKVLKDFTGVKTSTAIPEKSGGMFDGLMDVLKGMFDKFIEPFKWLWDNKDTFLRLLGWATGPLGLALLGVGAIAWLGEQLKNYFRENVANMNAISPEKAAELLQTPGAFREIEKYGGRDAVMKIAKEGHLEAAKVLASGDIKKINDAGGKDFLEQVVARGAVTVPESAATQDLSQFAETGPKRPKGTGLATQSNQAKWDSKWSKIYDPETGKRLDLLNAKNSTTPSITPPAATPVPATTTPVPATPASSAVVGKIQENNDLNLQDSITVGASSSPSVSVSNSSTSAPDQTVTATATTRDDTPILDLVMKRTKAQV